MATPAKTGFWLEEFAAHYYVFKNAVALIVVASPLGGQPPLDPKSDERGLGQEDIPFIKLASLLIPPQKVRTDDRAGQAEMLSFSPGNALSEHAPLGGLNLPALPYTSHFRNFATNVIYAPILNSI